MVRLRICGFAVVLSASVGIAGADVRSVEPLFGHRPDPAFDSWKMPDGIWGITNGVLHVTGQKSARLDYLAYPQAKPVPGPDAVVVRASGIFPAAAVLTLRNLQTGKSQKFVAKREADAFRFRTGLLSDELWQFAALSFKTDKKSSASWHLAISAIDAETVSSRAEALRLDVDTGDPIRVARPGQVRAQLLLTNPSDATIGWKGSCRMNDYFGATRSFPVSVEIPAGKTMCVPFDVPKGMGIWYVTVDLTADDGSVCQRKVRFAVLDENKVGPPLPDGKFRMGINYHMRKVLATEGLLEKTLHALDLCGAKLVRVDAGKYNKVQPTGPDDYRWSDCDRMVDLLERHGLAIDSIVFAVPEWARDTSGKDLAAVGRKVDNLPARRGLYRDFCEKLARRYGTRISYYEIGNEVDLRVPAVYGPDEYVERIYDEAYEGLKKGCPAATVMPGGFAFGKIAPQKGFEERFLTLAGGRMDAHPVHNHSPFYRYRETLGVHFLDERRRHRISVPWFANEAGISTVFGMEATAALTVWKKILWAWGNGSRDYVWYNLRATGWKPDDGEQGFGMISADFQPRATFAAFAALANLVSGLDLERVPVQTDARFAYQFAGRKNGIARRVLAGWDEHETRKAPIAVRTDAPRVWTVDLMGNRTELKLQNGVVTWPLGKLPSALLAEGGTVFAPDADDLARPSAPPDDTIVPLAENGWSPEAFHLDKTGKIFDLYDANPATADRAWHGNADLSARVRLRPLKTVLALSVDVTDDIACQPFAGKKIHKGDSVQLLLAIPDAPGFWDIGLARLDDGRPLVFAWQVPSGVDPATAAEKIPLKVSRKGTVTRYEAELPFELFGFNSNILKDSGFRFDLLVRDNDGFGSVDCWTEVKPGVAAGQNVQSAPLVRFRKDAR